MAYEILKSKHDQLGCDLAAEIAKYRAAIEAHATTENVAAPVADPLVEAIVREHGGEFVVIDDTPPPLTFEQTRTRLCACVNMDAERERGRHITMAGTGQAMIYAEKDREATRWANAGRPSTVSADEYPWASERAERIGEQPADVLAHWYDKISEWFAAARAIENVREDSKERIRAASSIEQAQAIYDSIVWPEAST
jgi:hypothetical protein